MIEEKEYISAGWVFTKRDCQHCKQNDRNLISRLKGLDAEKYTKYYGHKNYEAYECHSCGSNWSFSTV